MARAMRRSRVGDGLILARRPAQLRRWMYDRLVERFGPQHWWPAKTPFEVMVGAILTQNTAWSNVERAVVRLKAQRLMTPARLAAAPTRRLHQCLRPAGYFRVKTRRLQAFLKVLQDQFQSDVRRLLALPTRELRQLLLGINGIGEETADSILLYAAHRPAFVVDAYTRRILVRHRLISPKATYAEVQQWFTRHLPGRASLYNEFHALIVALGKTTCRSVPQCERCPLRPLGKGVWDGA